MNRRFVLSFAVAVLLGFVSAQTLPENNTNTTEPINNNTNTTEPINNNNQTEPVINNNQTEPVVTKNETVLQEEFLAHNQKLSAYSKLDDDKRLQCNQFVDYAYFNLYEVHGPYFIENVNFTGGARDVELRFCIPSIQNASDPSSKSSLAYILGSNYTKETRLTSGSARFESVNTVRPDNEEDWDILGLRYTAQVSSDICIEGANETDEDIYYTTEFTVRCNREVTEIRHDSIKFYQDSENQCLLHAEITHRAGCPTFEYGALVQYFMSHPYLIALALISFGVVATFFGGLLFDYVVAVLAGVISFFILCMLFQTIGMFEALAAKSKPSGGLIFLSVLGFLLAGAASVLAGWFVKKTARIAKTILGCVGGFFVSILIYGLLFAKLVTHSTWLIWIVMVVGTVAGGYLVYKYDKAILVELTATVGAYTIIRGISLIAGGYISEFDIMDEMKSGNFDLPNTFYAYLAGFVALAVAGSYFQISKNYHKHIVEEGDLDEHFLPVDKKH